MNLTSDDLKHLMTVAVDAAFAAGQIIRASVGRTLLVEKKETGSSLAAQAVTEVDLAAQKKILEYITPTQKKYDLGLLTEESEDGRSRLEKDFFWCVDPLDGTLPFIEIRPGYAVSIALVSKAGEPMLGIVYDPPEDNLYCAMKGGGAFKNKERWSLKKKHTQKYKVIDSGGAVMNACNVLENAPAVFFKPPKETQGGGCLWDYAATTCLFTELGGWVSDARGEPLELNSQDSLYMNKKGVLFATSPQLAKFFILK